MSLHLIQQKLVKLQRIYDESVPRNSEAVQQGFAATVINNPTVDTVKKLLMLKLDGRRARGSTKGERADFPLKD